MNHMPPLFQIIKTSLIWGFASRRYTYRLSATRVGRSPEK